MPFLQVFIYSLQCSDVQNLPKPFPKLFSIAANPFLQYLAPLGAKYMGRIVKKNEKFIFVAFYICLHAVPLILLNFQAVIKSAASAASPHGFSSRDPVGC